jgi:hypothetical protein
MVYINEGPLFLKFGGTFNIFSQILYPEIAFNTYSFVPLINGKDDNLADIYFDGISRNFWWWYLGGIVEIT